MGNICSVYDNKIVPYNNKLDDIIYEYKQSSKRVLLLGLRNSGKTYILQKYIENISSSSSLNSYIKPTDGNHLQIINYNHLNLIDTSGKIQYHVQNLKLVSISNYIIYVIDISNTHVYFFAITYLQQILSNILLDNVKILIILNEISLLSQEESIKQSTNDENINQEKIQSIKAQIKQYTTSFINIEIIYIKELSHINLQTFLN